MIAKFDFRTRLQLVLAPVSARPKLASKTAQSVIGLLLAIVLLWLFFRGTDFGVVWDSVRTANFAWIAVAVIATYANYFVRAVRWQVLLAPIGRPRLWDCFVYTVIGFMVNVLVPPGRVGEVVRPYLLARKWGFSASSAFATIFLERILDLGAIILLVGSAIVLAWPAGGSEQIMDALRLGGLVALAGAVGLFVVLFVFARFPKGSVRIVERVCGILPKRIAAVLTRFAELFAAGLGSMNDVRSLLVANVLSVVLWLCIGAAYWLGAKSLGIDFGYLETFLVLGFLSLGVLIPTPGAVGGYHLMSGLALTTLFGVEESVAKAASLVNHAIAFIPVVVAGLLLLPAIGVSLGSMQTIADTSKEQGEEQERESS